MTPSLNQGQFIRATIDSVLGQGYSDLELWVIDGGSTDGTLEILASYGGRVRWVSEPDSGQAEAINKGLRRATGEVVGWLNSDDTYLPGALQAVGEFFARNAGTAAVYGDAHYVDRGGRIVGPYPTRDFDWERLAHECYLCQPAVFFRRGLVDRLGGLDTDLAVALDYDLWIRYFREHRPVRLARPLATSRMYPDNKTLALRSRGYGEIFRIVRRHYGYVPYSWALGRPAMPGIATTSTTIRGARRRRFSFWPSLPWHGTTVVTRATSGVGWCPGTRGSTASCSRRRAPEGDGSMKGMAKRVVGRVLRSAGVPSTPPATSVPPAEPPVAPDPPIYMQDTYIQWLMFANAGMLHGGNVYCFDYAIRNLPSAAPMVEIGSFCGLSTNAITYFKRRHGATNRLVTSDRWVFEGAMSGTTVGQSPLTHDEYQAFVKETFRRNVELFSRGDLPYTIELFSDEFFDAWREHRDARDVFDRPICLGGPISFCYIDGNHTYEFARRDFEHCDEFLERGGFILFDDSADGSGWEVCRVVQEVAAAGRYGLVVKSQLSLPQKYMDPQGGPGRDLRLGQPGRSGLRQPLVSASPGSAIAWTLVVAALRRGTGGLPGAGLDTTSPA